MIKIVLHLAKAAIAAITALLVFSCGANLPEVDGSGNVVKQNRPAQEEFTSIYASQGLEVVIEQSTVKSIVVEADDNLHKHIKTEIKNGVLEISSDAEITNSTAQRIIVTLPKIEKVEATSSASVKTKSTIKGKTIEFSTSSGGTMDINIDAENVTLEAGSGSHLKVNGRAESLQAEASSGATVNAKALAAQRVEAEASSGGTTYVNPVENLQADASSGGHVYYAATPKQLEMKTSSGGNVSQK
jgi:hypothetical protein